ncbi:response regulator transcription factor [Streptomyces sp. NPDC000994]
MFSRGSGIKSAARQNTEHEVGRDHHGLLDVPRWVLDANLSLLTPREREVLVALGDCLPNAAIASGCHITERTVKKHVASIFFKLEISSRAEAAVIATCKKHELRPNGVPSDTSVAYQGHGTV